MEETLFNLKELVLARRDAWENAKEPQHVTSIFVCNRRIQKLNEALKFIAEIKLIDEYTARRK